MTGLNTILNGLKFLKRNLNDLIQDAVIETQDSAVDFNRKQLRKGIDSNGNEIRPSYRSPFYARLKQNRGSQAPAGTPDLKVSGDYYKQLKAKVSKTKLEIVNSGSKDYFKKLDEKYSTNKGLNEKSQMEYVRRFIVPRIKEDIKNIFANV